jgi:hypothetical protein
MLAWVRKQQLQLITTPQYMDIPESHEPYNWSSEITGGPDYEEKLQTMSKDVQNVSVTRSTTALLRRH